MKYALFSPHIEWNILKSVMKCNILEPLMTHKVTVTEDFRKYLILWRDASLNTPGKIYYPNDSHEMQSPKSYKRTYGFNVSDKMPLYGAFGR